MCEAEYSPAMRTNFSDFLDLLDDSKIDFIFLMVNDLLEIDFKKYGSTPPTKVK